MGVPAPGVADPGVADPEATDLPGSGDPMSNASAGPELLPLPLALPPRPDPALPALGPPEPSLRSRLRGERTASAAESPASEPFSTTPLGGRGDRGTLADALPLLEGDDTELTALLFTVTTVFAPSSDIDVPGAAPSLRWDNTCKVINVGQRQMRVTT